MRKKAMNENFNRIVNLVQVQTTSLQSNSPCTEKFELESKSNEENEKSNSFMFI